MLLVGSRDIVRLLIGIYAGLGVSVKNSDPRASFVAPASEDGVPSQVENRDSWFVKNHSSVGVAEPANVN